MTLLLERTTRRSLHDLTFSELERELVAAGVRPAHTQTVWQALHRDTSVPLNEREDFLPPVRRWVEAALGEDGGFFLEAPEVTTEVASSDGLTTKFLLRLDDGQVIETVLMGYPGRFTACLSTQAGCAMGCVFCATGQMGFVRHLRAGEIVAQVRHVQRHLREAGQAPLRNLVLMGMGEPLHNYDAVMQALDIIIDTRCGAHIGPARISVSTVGVVPGILRLAEEKRTFNLAVSLHGATEEDRSALVPASKRWPLADVMAACRSYNASTGQRVFFGWTLIAGRNDSPEQAAKLVELLRGLDSHVNLIPLNPTDGYDGDTTRTPAVLAFQSVLQAGGIPCTIRQRRGIDVAAGCGQLKAAKREKPVRAVQAITNPERALGVERPAT